MPAMQGQPGDEGGDGEDHHTEAGEQEEGSEEARNVQTELGLEQAEGKA